MSSSETGGAAAHSHLVHEGTVTSIDIADDQSVEKLRSGSVGLLLILFLCVTGSAPLSVFMFNFPFAVGAGNEKYAPAAFFFAIVVPVMRAPFSYHRTDYIRSTYGREFGHANPLLWLRTENAIRK